MTAGTSRLAPSRRSSGVLASYLTFERGHGILFHLLKDYPFSRIIFTPLIIPRRENDLSRQVRHAPLNPLPLNEVLFKPDNLHPVGLN